MPRKKQNSLERNQIGVQEKEKIGKEEGLG
jgi:hypothetical protein